MTNLWDIHNHILPEVDDGSRCMEEAYDLIRQEYQQGVRYIIFTPHYREGMFDVSREKCVKAYQELRRLYQAKWKNVLPGLVFAFGCEFHVHPFHPELLEDRTYRMPGEKVVLAEFDGSDSYSSIKKRLVALTEMGYTCIVAHVERYNVSVHEIELLHDLPNVYLQVNAESIIGDAGVWTKWKMEKLLKKNLIDLVGSDAHNVETRPVKIGECAEWIHVKYGRHMVKEMFLKNPEKIFIK